LVVFLNLLWPDLIVGYLSFIGTAMAHPFVLVNDAFHQQYIVAVMVHLTNHVLC
jgi:hypothetical protein